MKSILTIVLAICSISAFAQDLQVAWDKNSDLYGYKDSKGNLVIPYKYSNPGKFSEGLAEARLNKKSGFINTEDKTVIPLIYEDVKSFSEGLAPVQLNGKWGFINKNGRQIIGNAYEDAEAFHEGLAAVKLNKKWGFINGKGKVMIAPAYDRVKDFMDGMAAVAPVRDAGWGYINKEGKMIIPVQYKNANYFSDGVALVGTDKGYFHIDKTGKPLDGKDQVNRPAAASTKTAIAETPIYAQHVKNKATVPGKTPYTELEKSNLKLAKDAGNWQYVGFMYIDHGNIEEGTALIKQEIAKGDCENCGARLAYVLFEARFPKTALQACKSASDKLQYAGSVSAAVNTLRKFEAQGDMPMAAYYLADGFENGYIHAPQKEIDSAMYYYQKAAMQGCPPAMFALGSLYQYANGNGIPIPSDRNKYAYLIDKKKARYWYNEAAKNGNQAALQRVALLDKAAAAADLADAYSKGFDAFQAKNYEAAYRWWKVSASEGKDAAAFYGLAVLHHLGKAPGSDYNTAMEYYQKAADMGMKEALAEKQKILDYFAALNAARQKSAATTTTAAKGESYEEWWQKTYGRGGTQNSTPMPNNNIPQARYRTGSQSESDRHQSAMDQIYRDAQRQMERSFKKY